MIYSTISGYGKMACKFWYTYDLLEVTSSEAWERGAAGPSFDVSAPRNVTALKDANAYLHCIVNNLANKTVSMQQRDLNTNISNPTMPGWHRRLMRWRSSMLVNAIYLRSHPRTDFFVLCACCCVRFLASLCYQEYLCIHTGELIVWILFPTIAIHNI